MNSRSNRKFIPLVLIGLWVWPMPLFGQKIQLTHVMSKRIEHSVELPGEFYPFLSVQLHAKVPGYVEKVYVDRGSFVKAGELLVQLSAPEMIAKISQAEAQLTSAEAEEGQAEAELGAAESTFTRTQEASKTPGAIAGNDLVLVKQQVDAAQALVRSRQRTVDSSKSSLQAQRDLASYLRVTAPFAGVISTRYVHPGALVGPGEDVALLQLDQISHLRLAVAVPEADVSGLVKGGKVEFRVPAYADREFSGTIARLAYVVDMKTRTMLVELDVVNPQHLLAPGMYPSVLWPIERSAASLLVPPASIVTTTERVFVIRDSGGRAEWVDVRRGATVGKLVEISGNLRGGDEIVERGTDEIRDGEELRLGDIEAKQEKGR